VIANTGGDCGNAERAEQSTFIRRLVRCQTSQECLKLISAVYLPESLKCMVISP